MAATHRIVNGVQVPLTSAEAAAIEAEWTANAPGTGPAWTAEQAAALAKLRAQAVAVFADVSGDTQALAKATRALALVMLDEINILRTAAGLSLRTAAQLKTAIRAKINAGEVD